MKKILLLLILISLTSCGLTQAELINYNIKQADHCKSLGLGYWMSG